MRVKCVVPVLFLVFSACTDDDPSSSNADVAATDLGGDTQGDSSDLSTDVEGEQGSSECEGPFESVDVGFIGLDDDGLSETLFFTVPSCAIGFTVVVTGQDDVSFILEELIDPNGEVLITSETDEPLTPLELLFLGAFPGQFLSPNRMVQAEGVATALVPNTPSVTFVGGEYQMVVQGGWPVQGYGGTIDVEPFTGTVQVDVIWKNADTLSSGGTLDVNLYFSGAGGVDADSAPTDTFIGDAMDELARIYGQAGVAIGEVTYHNVDSSYEVVESMAGPGNELSALFEESEGNPEGLNYFFVSRFELSDLPGGMVAGISGGIPGPPFRPGSPRSGVAVALEMAVNDAGILDAGILAHVMAHEGGHYLGLFHTVEIFGGEDPIDDTPTGTSSSNNLMYPSVGGDTNLTEGQTQVMHTNLEVAP